MIGKPYFRIRCINFFSALITKLQTRYLKRNKGPLAPRQEGIYKPTLKILTFANTKHGNSDNHECFYSRRFCSRIFLSTKVFILSTGIHPCQDSFTKCCYKPYLDQNHEIRVTEVLIRESLHSRRLIFMKILIHEGSYSRRFLFTKVSIREGLYPRRVSAFLQKNNFANKRVRT